MFIFLSKFLPQFVYPLGLVTLLVAAALLLSRKPKLQRCLLIAVLGVLLIGGNRWTTAFLIRSLEQQTPVSGELPEADAIVVLGGGTEPLQAPRQMVELNSAGDRVVYAGKLWKDGKAPVILASGGAIEWMGRRGMTPAEESVAILRLMEIPADRILIQDQSLTTYDESVLDQKLLAQRGMNKVLLVTSAMHMPRAAALFRAQGLEVIPAPTDYKISAVYWEDLLHPSLETLLIGFIPSGDEIGLFSVGLKEYIGLWVYKMRGWV